MKLNIPLISSVFIIIVLFVSINVLNCKGEDMSVDLSELKAVPQKKWDKLAEKRIYFGHQSVGYNIMDGVKSIMNELPNIKLNIVETKDPKDFNGPIFAHSPNGMNKDPFSKIDAFKEGIETKLADKVDIAFFKFCYIDIMEHSDVNAVFDHYMSTMSELKEKYPEITFVDFSVPIRTVNVSVKAQFKRLVKANVWGDKDNINRNIYNEMLREKCDSEKSFFDIAAIESLNEDGKNCLVKLKGKKYPLLCPEYSSDGGHLNEKGKLHIAKYLLLFLSEL